MRNQEEAPPKEGPESWHPCKGAWRIRIARQGTKRAGRHANTNDDVVQGVAMNPLEDLLLERFLATRKTAHWRVSVLPILSQ